MNREDTANQLTARGPEPSGPLPLFLRCQDCPYPSPGFVCWNGDGSCMATRYQEIMDRDREKKTVKSG